MVGFKTGLVGHLKQLGVKCVFLHCIIHQEALCGNKPQRHRAFITLLEEMDADYGDIPLHYDIRWLSVAKRSQRFSSLFYAKKINSSVSSN
jgi:hypothetical protein